MSGDWFAREIDRHILRVLAGLLLDSLAAEDAAWLDAYERDGKGRLRWLRADGSRP